MDGSVLTNAEPRPSSTISSKPIRAQPPSSSGAFQTRSIVVSLVRTDLGAFKPVGSVHAVNNTGLEVGPSPLKFTAETIKEYNAPVVKLPAIYVNIEALYGPS